MPPALTAVAPVLVAGPVAVAEAVPGPTPEDTLTAAPGVIPLTVDPVGLDVTPTLKPDPGGPETDCVDVGDDAVDPDDPDPGGAWPGAWPGADGAWPDADGAGLGDGAWPPPPAACA